MSVLASYQTSPLIDASAIFMALKGRGKPNDFTCRCPAHEDRNPSLSVSEKDGRVLVHCHAGCPQEAVIAALRDKNLWPESKPNGAANGHHHSSPAPRWRPISRENGRAEASEIEVVTPEEFRLPPTLPAPTTDDHVRLYRREALASSNVLREHVYYQGGVPVFIKRRLSKGPKFLPYYRVEDGAAELWQSHEPVGFKKLPYVSPGHDPFKSEGAESRSLFWCEGERDVDTVAKLGLEAFTFGAAKNIPAGAELYVKGRKVVIPVDNDDAGRRDAEAKAQRCWGHATSIKVISFPELPAGGDISDWLVEHKRDELRQKVLEAPEYKPEQPDARTIGDRWPEPKPLPDGLLPVAPFDFEYLPRSIAPWVQDIAERMQCAPDFVAIPAIAALGSLIGRKVCIRPQRHTDWSEVPNIWACIIGRPGVMKSPAMSEALKPLHRLEANARKQNETDYAEYRSAVELHTLQKEDVRRRARDALKEGNDTSGIVTPLEPQEPRARRFVVNDTSYEKLGEILSDNPNGVLAFRDELVSMLKALDREEHASARGFFLTAWNGKQGYTFDRITRGRVHIEAACVSLLGSTQPGRISEYMRRAVSGGAGDDGLIQRFGLLVWPDQDSDWVEIDRYPLTEARTAAWEVFEKLDSATPVSLGAEFDEFEPLPFLHFDDAAQERFTTWRANLEAQIRSGGLHPALESHLAKYRKLVPSLALINHLADRGSGPVSDEATSRALAFTEYLETHAKRAYAAGSEAESAVAKAIMTRIRKGDLPAEFAARDIYRAGWSALSDRGQVRAGLDLLVDLDRLEVKTVGTDGRAKTMYVVNPRGLS